MYLRSLFIFRRDLRLHDNTALYQACQMSKEVILCFVLDEEQQKKQNDYFSQHAFDFMIQSLKDLTSQIEKDGGRLYVLQGNVQDCIEALHEEFKFQAIFFNKDYTPFSVRRDQRLERWADKHNILYHSYDDALLTVPGLVLNKQGQPYQVFTAFYNTCIQNDYSVLLPKAKGAWCIKNINQVCDLADFLVPTSLYSSPTHRGALQALAQALKLVDYDHIRDIPGQEDRMSHLSVYLKFGLISVRQVYHAVKDTLGLHHTLIKQLFWRDFFYHIAWHKPSVFGHAYQDKFDHIKWRDDAKLFQAWKDGRTGVPIVDAGMRQLASTGFMHNRVRMITASFLIKDLHISWLQGEKYFAQQLIDYDPCVNNGNWQWVAGTGCDAAPYFRIFNPWLQQKKFDPDALYIKQWVPELADISPKIIHNSFLKIAIPGYILPIVDHSQQIKITKKIYIP